MHKKFIWLYEPRDYLCHLILSDKVGIHTQSCFARVCGQHRSSCGEECGPLGQARYQGWGGSNILSPVLEKKCSVFYTHETF